MPGNAETDGIRAAQWQKFAASGSIYDYLITAALRRRA